MNLSLTILGHTFGVRGYHWDPDTDGIDEIVSDCGHVELSALDDDYDDCVARMGFGSARSPL